MWKHIENILGWYYKQLIIIWNKLVAVNLHCIVIYSSLWIILSFISNFWYWFRRKKRHVECGAFWKGDPGSTTITIHLIFMSKWITQLSSVNHEIILESIPSVIFFIVIFVMVSIFLEQIQYFVLETWRGGSTDQSSIFPGWIVDVGCPLPCSLFSDTLLANL